MIQPKARRELKHWPCGCDFGNPWHYDCKDKRCAAFSKATGEGLGITCVHLPRPRKTAA